MMGTRMTTTGDLELSRALEGAASDLSLVRILEGWSGGNGGAIWKSGWMRTRDGI